WNALCAGMYVPQTGSFTSRPAEFEVPALVAAREGSRALRRLRSIVIPAEITKNTIKRRMRNFMAAFRIPGQNGPSAPEALRILDRPFGSAGASDWRDPCPSFRWRAAAAHAGLGCASDPV